VRFWNGVRLNAGKVPSSLPSISFSFTDSHVISLTTPETEQVIVCLVCVFMAFFAFDLVCFFICIYSIIQHGLMERITEEIILFYGETQGLSAI
jgi:hypothetical protein